MRLLLVDRPFAKHTQYLFICVFPFDCAACQRPMSFHDAQARFLFPVLPLFNMAAASAIARLHVNRGKGTVHMLAALAVYGAHQSKRHN